ncbi:MAG: MFS transporter, partial [Clostridia bacterium]|nr:MFS transporter [Clostridia bacterium]
PILCYIGLVLTGVGCAPVYPAIIHSTPSNFGEQNSQAIIGVQMAFAYTGCALMPPLFGLISTKFMAFYPYFLAIFLVLMVVMFAIVQKILKRKEISNGKVSKSV